MLQVLLLLNNINALSASLLLTKYLIVKQEQLNLETQLDQWKKLYESNAPVYERLEQVKIVDYLKESQKLVKMMK